MNNLVTIKGYKLPAEDVWVTTTDMYEVYSTIRLTIDGAVDLDFVITEIHNEGVCVEILH